MIEVLWGRNVTKTTANARGRPAKRQWRRPAALLAALLLCGAAGKADDALRFVSLAEPARSAGLRDWAGAPRVLMFWRSDCTPCLVELAHIAELRAAAGRGRLLTIALEPREQALRALRARGAPTDDAWIAQTDPEEVLVAMSGARRLPLSVALDARGRICRTHVGLLGTERVRAWIAACSA